MATTMSRLAMTVILLVVSLGQAAAQITSPGPKAQAHKRPIDPLYESVKRPESTSPIDRAVFAKLAELGIEPVLCSDAVFVRRAYLDVIGTLPTADEAREFLDEPDSAHRRAALIDRLLERDEFADYWAMKWGDLLRIKAEFPVNLWPNAAQAYHRWVRESIAENKPYDQFVRELLTASGSNFRVGPVNFYRAVQNRTPEGIATAVALTFMGARAEAWPKERLAGMAAFFSQIGYKPTREWKEECVFWDPFRTVTQREEIAPEMPRGLRRRAAAPGPQTAPRGLPRRQDRHDPARPRPARGLRRLADPAGESLVHARDRQPRLVLAAGPRHHPRAGRHPRRQPASNPELLAYLEQELVAGHYDLKHLYRLILNSQTYQLSSMPTIGRSRRPRRTSPATRSGGWMPRC